jgi:hypothetical protein
VPSRSAKMPMDALSLFPRSIVVAVVVVSIPNVCLGNNTLSTMYLHDATVLHASCRKHYIFRVMRIAVSITE